MFKLLNRATALQRLLSVGADARTHVAGQIAVIRADGAGGVETIVSSALSKPPQSWSRDGKYLLFQISEAGRPADIWLLSMDDRKAMPLLNAAFGESEARFSPDMKWITYTSNPSGKA